MKPEIDTIIDKTIIEFVKILNSLEANSTLILLNPNRTSRSLVKCLSDLDSLPSRAFSQSVIMQPLYTSQCILKPTMKTV